MHFKLINNLITKAKSQRHLDKLQGLRAVFQELLADKVKLDGSKVLNHFCTLMKHLIFLWVIR